MGKMKEFKEFEERSQEGAGRIGNVKLRNTVWRGEQMGLMCLSTNVIEALGARARPQTS
jgi:hypothetical protein